MSLRPLLCGSVLGLALIAASGGVQAGGLSGSLTLTSDYVFRGFTQTDEKPALQGGLEYEADSGFYVGTWGSSISWLSDSDPDVSSQLELDGYIGYRNQLSDTISFDVGALYYGYPGSYPAGFNDPDTVELYAGLGIGIFSVKYSYAVTDLFGVEDSDGSSYLEGGVDWGFADTWSLGLHAGKQFISGAHGDDYIDWSVGINKTFANDFDVGVTYTDVDADNADSRLFIALTKSF